MAKRHKSSIGVFSVFFSYKRNLSLPVSVSYGGTMEWNDDDLTCFTFCQISLSISLSSAPERTTEEEGREKGFF